MSIILHYPAAGATLTLHSPEQADFIARADDRAAQSFGKLDWLHLTAHHTHGDRSQGVGVHFVWSGTEGRCTLRLRCAYEERVLSVNGREAVVYNLYAGTSYTWQVICGEDAAEGQFCTADAAPRFLRVDGVNNVRDFGVWRGMDGRRLKQGMIYRGSEMDTHMHITPDGVMTLLQELHVRTDLDLRRTHEARPALPQEKVRWTRQSILAYDAIDGPVQAAYFRKCYDLLLDPASYPIYVHCWGGADRTGIFFFLLDAVLGVALDDLLLDFELTSLCIWGDRSRDMPEFRAFSAYLQRYGEANDTLPARAVAFLRAVGVTDAEMRRLRELLLEDAPGREG